MKYLFALISLMVLVGCVSAGVKVDESQLRSFVKGKTSHSEIVSALGPPTANTLLSDGRRLLVYNWVQARARPETFIPIAGAVVGGADGQSSMVMIWITAEGLLDSYSVSQSQVGLRHFPQANDRQRGTAEDAGQSRR